VLFLYGEEMFIPAQPPKLKDHPYNSVQSVITVKKQFMQGRETHSEAEIE